MVDLRKKPPAGSGGPGAAGDEGNVKVLSYDERRNFSGETIDETGAAAGSQRVYDAPPNIRSRVYVVNSRSNWTSKLLIAAIASAVLFFLFFVALPFALTAAALGAILWYLRRLF